MIVLDLFARFLSALFSVAGIIGFIAGVVCEYTFLRWRCHQLDKTDPQGSPHKVKIKRVYWVWALVFVVLGGVTVKTQTTYDQIVHLTRDTQECSRQFNSALKASADIGKEEREINARWQDEQFNRAAKLNDLLLKYGSTSAPGYLQERVPVDTAYYYKMNQLFNERNATFDARAKLGGYPEPTCGKS